MSEQPRSIESLIQDMILVGIPEELAREQYRLLERGTVYADLVDSAGIGNGIVKLHSDQVEQLIAVYDNRGSEVKILKFVPASGAASRMFKDLISEWKEGEKNSGSDFFFEHLDEIPFVHLLDRANSRAALLDTMLSANQLDLDNQPKGSIPFHRYTDCIRTAFEEHLVEGVDYATSGGKVHIHFTLSPEHMESVKADMDKWTKDYGIRLGCEYELEFSIQLPFTDTVPFFTNGRALKENNGRLKTRPGGHGALIYNLNKLEADIIFIKNIDNVVPDKHRTDTIRYKKALGGLLIQLRREARTIISKIKAQDTEENRQEAHTFLEKMGTRLDHDPSAEELIELMNRPYRVCGMVQNQGEPGGGPFWVKTSRGTSLQIVESAQVDNSDERALELLNRGTHFNPVDLVCSLNDLYGMKQDLLKYVDTDAAFVTSKFIDGVESKVIEWPGLWNGAMADWNTLFVEVPISTFNPVKTVNDLLRPMHQ